jgi:acetyl-CoA carboxylase biotin carboxyl carrier protein
MSVTSQLKIDPEAVRMLAELLRETDLTEIEYQVDSLRIKVLRSVTQAVVPVVSPAVSVAPHVASNYNMPTDAQSLENHPGVIEAQMVGTVYLSPGPGGAPFISLGDTVTQGQTLFIIEAMKVMNMIKAPRSGIVKHIFVKDSQPVEYGDPVVIID